MAEVNFEERWLALGKEWLALVYVRPHPGPLPQERENLRQHLMSLWAPGLGPLLLHQLQLLRLVLVRRRVLLEAVLLRQG